MNEGGKTAIEANNEVVSVAEVKAFKKRTHQLERVRGNKTLEVEILKEAIRIAREKNSSRGYPRPAWRISNETGRRRPGWCPDPTPMSVAAAHGLVRNDIAKWKTHSFYRWSSNFWADARPKAIGVSGGCLIGN